MYTVFNPNETILVDYRDDNFVVEDLLTRETCLLPKENFRGNSFKYNCDFFSKFLHCFPNKKFILFTLEGESSYTHLKTVNREGIFE